MLKSVMGRKVGQKWPKKSDIICWWPLDQKYCSNENMEVCLVLDLWALDSEIQWWDVPYLRYNLYPKGLDDNHPFYQEILGYGGGGVSFGQFYPNTK